MNAAIKACLGFMQRETVLCIALLLAVISAFLTPPNPAYLSYIDWNTLALLFSLMAVMKGFQKAGLFVYLGNQLLKRTDSSRKMMLVLVLLPFLLSMVITNDVSLITFVPFGLIVLRLANQEHLVVSLVVLQTVAANLGSMLTPMGNPQNLYLYTKSGMSFGALCHLMLPYVLISALCLILLVVLRRSSPISGISLSVELGDHKTLLCCLLGFLICLLGIFKIIPALVIALIVAIFLLIVDRPLLASVDYSLLGTFVGFFIFIGNIGCIDQFQSLLASLLEDHAIPVAILSSQLISNVPAALLLSGFTDQWSALIVGCNLGGLGTLIASMASLISYKMVAKDYPALRKKYLFIFTLCNVVLLVILFSVSIFLA